MSTPEHNVSSSEEEFEVAPPKQRPTPTPSSPTVSSNADDDDEDGGYSDDDFESDGSPLKSSAPSPTRTLQASAPPSPSPPRTQHPSDDSATTKADALTVPPPPPPVAPTAGVEETPRQRSRSPTPSPKQHASPSASSPPVAVHGPNSPANQSASARSSSSRSSQRARSSSSSNSDSSDHELIDAHRGATDVPTAMDTALMDPAESTLGGEGFVSRNDGSKSHRSPDRSRMRLPPLKRGQAASDMITRLVEHPLEAHQQWQPTGAVSTENSVARKTNFPYDPQQDPFLAQYWARKEQMRSVWADEARRRKHQKGSNQSLPRGAKRVGRQGSVDQMDVSTTSQHSLPVKASPSVAPDSPHSMSSVRTREGLGAPAWNVSSFPLNHTPVADSEFRSLKPIFAPTGSFVSKSSARNIELSWLQPIMTGEIATAEEAVALVKSKATRNLHTAQFGTLLKDDPTVYTELTPWSKCVINSPRSAIIVMRNGVQPYDLLRRPAKFYSKPAENVSMATLQSRESRAEEERQALLHSLQLVYEDLCGTMSHEDVVAILMPKDATASSSALVAERLEKDRRHLEFLAERSKKLSDLTVERAEANARKAIAIEALLTERERKKKAMIQAKADAMAAELEAKRRLMQRIEEEKAKMAKETLQAHEEKRERLTERLDNLKQQRHEETIERSFKKASKAQASQRKVAENEAMRLYNLSQAARLKAERVEAFHARAAEERAERAARNDDAEAQRELIRLRAEEHQLLLRQRVTERLEAAEERLEHFEQQRDRDRMLKSAALAKRHEQIVAAVAMAQQMELERAMQIQERQEAAQQAQRERGAAKAARIAEEAEERDFDVEHKRRVVDLTAQQLQFAKLCQLAEMQEREAEIALFELSKKQLAEATRQSRGVLRVQHQEMKEAAAAAIVKQQRETAVAIYTITGAKETFTPPAHLRNVSARIDASMARSASATPSANNTIAKQSKPPRPSRAKSALGVH